MGADRPATEAGRHLRTLLLDMFKAWSMYEDVEPIEDPRGLIAAIEAEAAQGAAPRAEGLDVERARQAFTTHDMEHHGSGGLHPESCDEWVAAEYARLEQHRRLSGSDAPLHAKAGRLAPQERRDKEGT